MKKQTIRNLIVVILFGIALAIPLLLMNFPGGQVSTTENRQLAPFPVSVDVESGTVSVSRAGVESWISDNIGFRDSLVKIYTIVKNKAFGLSTSSLVLTGRDGWYFYTGDYNIEIATGRYPLTEEDLQKIAEYQQNISNYYHSMGKEYILMLTPSKASVYSEYLPMQEEIVSYTPVDMVTDYLKKHTDVVVYNSKDALLAAKSEGQLFFKTDTHWNERGSYAAYIGLFNVMKEQGILSGSPLKVRFGEDERTGEFAAMLGNTSLLPTETVPVAQWDFSFHQVFEGAQLKSATELQSACNPAFSCAILKNDSIINKQTLEIYGDSQIGAALKIPYYLAEHFSQVFNYAIRNVSPVVDEIADPDVIVFSCSERYIKDLLTLPGNIPATVDAIPEVPVSDFTPDQGYGGMYIDFCNSHLVSEQGRIQDNLFQGQDAITLDGWAADFAAMQPLSALYVQVGETLLTCQYGTPRESVSSYFDTDDLLHTGFTVTIPAQALGGVSEISFLQISADGTSQYAPVAYTLQP